MSLPEEYTVENATHVLQCCRAIGRSRTNYFMKCIPMKKMPKDRLKIVVFGDRYWAGTEGTRRVRYVHESRLTLIEDAVL